MTKIAISSVCRAFDKSCVGTKVLNSDNFLDTLMGAVAGFTFPESGQGFIPLPALACEFLSSGDMPREGLKAEDYVVREWRGEMGMFAKRQHVPPWQLFKLAQHVPPTFCAAVVYTVDAYCADPQVHPDEIGALRMENATHVLVAVLGSRGPKTTLSSHRFVRNLAGGNLAFADKTQAELVEMAKDVVEYEQNWVTVAD